MPYTKHGHWYGQRPPGPDDEPPQLVARCGGPGLCPKCAVEAQQGTIRTEGNQRAVAT